MPCLREGFLDERFAALLLKVAIGPQRLACSSPTAGKTAAAFLRALLKTSTYCTRIERNRTNGNEA
jgi:hypothetical protein